MHMELTGQLHEIYRDSPEEPQITERCTWWLVSTSLGEFLYPADMFSEEEARESAPGSIINSGPTQGYGARLSVPGTLDCTDWAVFDCEDEAAEYLIEYAH